LIALIAISAGGAFAQTTQPPAPTSSPPQATPPQAAPPQQAPAVPPASASKPTLAPPQTSAAATDAPAASGSALPPQPPPIEKRGFFNDLGRWWDDSVAGFNDFNKKSAEAAKDAATATGQAMKSAADAMVRWPTSKVVEIHEVCPVAGNGAPDCQAAAVNACKTKGFAAGQPLDIRTAEKCTSSLWVSGQNPPNGECPVESMVLRAACE
jgi:hypothetical protein